METAFLGIGHFIQGELNERSEKKLGEANERAAKAERDTEKLRAATAWRNLSGREHRALAKALRESGPGASVRFSIVANDQESLYFASRISIPFRAAGWNVGYEFGSYMHEMLTGVLLPEPRDNWLEEAKAVNARVRGAFMAAEISFVNGWPMHPYSKISDNSALTAPVAWVYVGPKAMPWDSSMLKARQSNPAENPTPNT
jgi:hypothetical protein